MIRRLRSRSLPLPDGIPVSVFVDDVEFDDARPGHYLRIVEGGGRPGVAVVAVRGDEILLVRSHRYPVERWMWEVPRGFGEGSDPASDARRELREETGLEASSLETLGEIHANSGLLTGSVGLFLARIDPGGTPTRGDGEVEEFAWVPTAEVYRRATVGEITDAITIAALFRARDLLQQP